MFDGEDTEPRAIPGVDPASRSHAQLRRTRDQLKTQNSKLSFYTLAAAGSAELRVRGSVFAALAVPVSSEEEARRVLTERQRDRFDATHHCSGWVVRDGVRRANDAGEPSGSAGAPILAAIDAASLVDVAVIVSRHFGGTKLGIGGLARAYAEAAAAAIDDAPVRRGIRALALVIRYEYRHTSALMRVLEHADAVGIEHGSTAEGLQGEVGFVIPAHEEQRFHGLLRDASAGQLRSELVGERVIFRSMSGAERKRLS